MDISNIVSKLSAFSIATLTDGSTVSLPTLISYKDNIVKAHIPAYSISRDVDTLDFLPTFFEAEEGEDGYMVFPGNILCRFSGHENTKTQPTAPLMPLFGAVTSELAFAGIVVGGRHDSVIMADIEDGKYRAYPRFLLEGEGTLEDLSVEYHILSGEDSNYSGMARVYRNMRLNSGLLPLAERAKKRPELAYAADSVYVRIRMAWKPVPSPVAEQTPENEPSLFTACTCKQVERLMEAMRKEGIDKAEICLVGWNIRGHDGRWPQAFPVEKDIGGEAELRSLIKKAQSLGYQITCHTNSSDAYRIADCWSEEYIRKNKDGSLQAQKCGSSWSGGQTYNTCPKASFDISVRMLDQVAELGFRGLHYIDVISIVPPKKCASENHPLSRKEDAEWNQRIFKYACDKFGGISSEGGFDHMSDTLDYGLYIDFGGNKSNPLCDEDIPLWQLVYNGIIMQNPSTTTLNYTIKDEASLLKEIEFCGRPSFYYYSRFVTEVDGRKNWMGDVDMRCGTDEEIELGVKALRRAYDEYQKRKALQYQFMEKHEKLAEQVYRVTYSDGTVILINRSEEPYKPENLDGKSYRII